MKKSLLVFIFWIFITDLSQILFLIILTPYSIYYSFSLLIYKYLVILVPSCMSAINFYKNKQREPFPNEHFIFFVFVAFSFLMYGMGKMYLLGYFEYYSLKGEVSSSLGKAILSSALFFSLPYYLARKNKEKAD